MLNDGALGSIRDIQEHRLGDRIIGTEFEFQPDFAAIAEGCGCHGERVTNPDGVEAALARALEANSRGVPAVIDFIVARERVAGTLEYSGFFPDHQLERARRGLATLTPEPLANAAPAPAPMEPA